MARFYDAINDVELARVEAFLKKRGIEYTIREAGKGVSVKEINVAEEDVLYAEELVTGGHLQ